MTDSPPTHPDAEQADQAALSVQEQLDALLVQIETAEPGTVDPSALPAGFVSEHQPPANTPEPAPAMQAFEQALAADAPSTAPAAQAIEEEVDPDKSDVENSAEQEMLAMLNQSLQGMNSDSADEPAAPAEAAPAPAPDAQGQPASEPAPAGEDEADMLAALNAALQDLNPDASPAATEPAPAEPSGDIQDEIHALLDQTSDAAEPADQADPNADLQDEISALLDQPADSAAATTSTEDQIAEEIEGLLDTTADEPTADGEPTIGDLDQMLAEEIDEDDELAGDFQSVEDITAGIVTDDADETLAVDEHAATARDVAAELDNQPEDGVGQASGNEDPMATIAAISETAQRNAELEESNTRDWRAMLVRGKQRLLEACFVINWPARRFLSPEYRATLGYIALLNLFFAVATWFALILF